MIQTDFSSALQGTNEIEITVTGRKSGRSISLPVWFVHDGDTLYLLPAKGIATEWYKNVRTTPAIRLTAKGKTLDATAVSSTGEAQVQDVVQKFRDKYGAGTVNRLYYGFNAAVEIPLA